ncbi:MAG: AraC family transcriptional regulator [Dysgonamonadaceae bacterium]|nr:AraC family transcriptional regulator [Dysgonamonadaceae bacterium]
MLVTTNLTIQEIMYQTGFINRSHFYKEFAKRYGKSPIDFLFPFNTGTMFENGEPAFAATQKIHVAGSLFETFFHVFRPVIEFDLYRIFLSFIYQAEVEATRACRHIADNLSAAVDDPLQKSHQDQMRRCFPVVEFLFPNIAVFAPVLLEVAHQVIHVYASVFQVAGYLIFFVMMQ